MNSVALLPWSESTKGEKNDAMRDLHKMPWYHGLRSRTEIMPLFKNKGDFLVRATRVGKRIEVLLSVCLATKKDEPPKVVHLSLFYNPTEMTWELSLLVKQRSVRGRNGNNPQACRNRFLSVAELVDYYKTHSIVGDVKLERGIERPKWLIPTCFLRFSPEKDFLGKGNFAQVVKGKLKNGRKSILVAIKMLLPNETADEKQKEEAKDALLKEAQLMNRYNHRNVIKFYGVACDKPPVMVIMEYCPGGSLESVLQTHGDAIQNAERLIFLLEAARGLRYLHYHLCIHRDLACRNCLISVNGALKISDFGLSKILDKNDGISEEDKTINKKVPLRWMAPETISRFPRYSNKSDIWSYGVMIYEVMNNGIKPWADTDDYRMISLCIRKGPMPTMPKRTPESILQIVKRCWELRMDDRPEFREIVKELSRIQNSEPELKRPLVGDRIVSKLAGVTLVEEKEAPEDLLAEKSLQIINLGYSLSPTSSEYSNTADDATLRRGPPSQMKSICSVYESQIINK